MRLTGLVMSLVLAAAPLAVAQAAPGRADAGLPSDTPAKFELVQPDKDYIKRVEMIPMRDGVKLYTVIWIPKGAKNAPIILTRTPYNAAGHKRTETANLITTISLEAEPFVENGYIRIYQDVRGKYGSEGDYVMTRPPIGPLNPTKVDHTTDAWDTIDWLVKHLPESNGKVGMIGSSYEGFTVVMALLNPHPALKAAVPESPMVDGWMGDDWFHYGAFRNPNVDYTLSQTAQRGEGKSVPREGADDYTTYLNAGSTGDYARARGLDKLPFIQKLFDHPAYDAFWQGQALDKLIVEHPSTVPTLWEQGLWDQEDMWGANHSWLALKAAGHEATNWLVMGPWFHSQVNREGYSLGPFRWNGDTALQFRREMVLPFFNQYLKDGPPANLARVTVYNDAENHWDRFADWPSACDKGCAKPLTPIYLQAAGGLGFGKPAGAKPTELVGDSYVSDPAKPVLYTPRPVKFSDSVAWRTWLVRDQRFVDGRPDVLTYQTAPLKEAVKLEGAPIADIVAMTTGTDGDFVVKLIDVFPDNVPAPPETTTNPTEFGGYEMPIGTDIFRGRYRESFEHPTPIPANTPQHYKFTLPNTDHVFLPGHRIMVQVQSTLFPLYDRNPQTFVPNIFNAKPADYQKATVTVLRAGDFASAVWLPIVAAK
jgi:putative CocE/NonD family hydrolase